MTYISHAAALLREAVNRLPSPIILGENVDRGSMLSGLCKGLTVPAGGQIVNCPNTEAAHAGLGLGIMLSGGHAVLVVKQFDFLFLMTDQLLNTANMIRAMDVPIGSFDIVTTIVDVPHQGPQSSFTRSREFGELVGVPVLHAASHVSMEQSFAEIGQPGVRITALFQSLYNTEL